VCLTSASLMVEDVFFFCSFFHFCKFVALFLLFCFVVVSPVCCRRRRFYCCQVPCLRVSVFLFGFGGSVVPFRVWSFWTAHLLAATGSSRLILLLCNFRIARRRKDHGGLWLSYRWLWCAPIYSDSVCGLFGWQTLFGVGGVFWLGQWWCVWVASRRCCLVRLFEPRVLFCV